MNERSTLIALAAVLFVVPSAPAGAQETDVTQTPNTMNAGIKKSYADEIGAGRGDVLTSDSSVFIIQRDPARAIVRGRQVFQRKFTAAQGLGPRTRDGVGDLDLEGALGAGLTDSCAACHGRPQGSAGVGGNVFTRPASRDAPHLFGLGLIEMLADEITQELRGLEEEAIEHSIVQGASLSIALRSKGIDFGTLVAHPDGSVDTSGVEGVDPDLRVRPFFAQGGTISIREFAVGAFNAEMGLQSPDPDLAAAAAGADVLTPSGMLLSGSRDAIEGAPAAHAFDDPDQDGVVNEVPTAIVDYMEFYLLNYFKPAATIERGGRRAERGRELFDRIGCTDCHVPSLKIDHDRRVADVVTRFDPPLGNPFNQLYSEAVPLFDVTDDGTGLPSLKRPRGGSFVVDNLYADFKRHDLGPNFWERNFDGTLQKEFMTEPLWGVGSTGPYGHDGRSLTLDDVILRHGGEARAARDRYAFMHAGGRRLITEFLQTLVLFPPPATASALNPKNPADPEYPVAGHGSIDLSVLFNDPTDKE